MAGHQGAVGPELWRRRGPQVGEDIVEVLPVVSKRQYAGWAWLPGTYALRYALLAVLDEQPCDLLDNRLVAVLQAMTVRDGEARSLELETWFPYNVRRVGVRCSRFRHWGASGGYDGAFGYHQWGLSKHI